MSLSKLLATVFLSLLIGSAFAGTVKVPAKRPAITVEIPDSWEPEETDRGVACESPDQAATVFFEVVGTEKGMNSLLDENFEWLVKDQGVKINDTTKQEKDMLVAGIKSSVLSFDANSKEFGPAKVGFIFTPVGTKVLVTTYWITNKGAAKHDATLTRIFNSIKPIVK